MAKNKAKDPVPLAAATSDGNITLEMTIMKRIIKRIKSTFATSGMSSMRRMTRPQTY